MSGAAEHVMDVDRRMDDTTALANDGSSVDVLMVALSPIARLSSRSDFVSLEETGAHQVL